MEEGGVRVLLRGMCSPLQLHEPQCYCGEQQRLGPISVFQESDDGRDGIGGRVNPDDDEEIDSDCVSDPGSDNPYPEAPSTSAQTGKPAKGGKTKVSDAEVVN